MAGIGISVRRPLTIFIAALLSLLILMSYQVTDEATGRTVFSKVIFFIFSPIQAGAGSAAHSVSDAVSNYFYLKNTNQENQRLKKELAEAKIKLAATVHQKEENDRLREILELRKKLPMTLLTGELIGRSAKTPVASSITANRGSRHGVKVQLPVVTPKGVVGMTVEVSPVATRVQLITDASSSIGAMLQGSQVAGILAGTGGEFCVLRFLPLVTKVEPNDVVVTSGQDGVFPEGLPIGRVTRLLQESDLYISAEVAAFQNQTTLKEVVFLLETPELKAEQ